MNKFGRRLSALLLAAAVAVSTVTPAFAATSSPTQGGSTTPQAQPQTEAQTQPQTEAVIPAGTAVSGNSDVVSTTVSGVTNSDATMTVNNVTSSSKSVTIPATLTATNGKTYNVDVIETNTIKEKYKSVTLILNPTTQVKREVAKLKKAKKTKKIIIRAAKDDKSLKASQFSKKAFKKFKGKIIVKKSAMTKKQFRKLKKKLRKGGFKGKIRYKK